MKFFRLLLLVLLPIFATAQKSVTYDNTTKFTYPSGLLFSNVSLFGELIIDSGDELQDTVDYSLALTPNGITPTENYATPRPQTVATIASLIADVDPLLVPTYAQLNVLGYYSSNDGGGGTFRRVLYSSVSGTYGEGGMWFQSSSNPLYAWERVYNTDGVNVKWFGAKGDDSNDDIEEINSAILWGAQNGVPVTIPDGRYRYSTPILVQDNNTVIGTPNGILRPEINGSDGTATYSFLRNTNLFSGLGPTPRTNVAALATNIVLRGLKFEAVAGSCTNVRGISLIGVHNVVLEDIEIDRTYDNWAFTFFAQDLRASKLRVKNNQTIFEDGIHVLGGERMVFSDSQIQSGDDSLAIGWDASDTFCRDIVFNGATLKSYRAFPIKVFAAPEMTSGSTCVEKVIFANIVGEGGINRNGGVFIYEQGTPRGAITNITLSNIKLTVNSGAHDGTNPYGVWILGGSEIDLNDVTVQGNDGYSLYLDSPKGPIRVNGGSYGTPSNSSTESVFVYQGFTNAVTFSGVSISDTTYRPIRSIESDIIVSGGVINSGGSLHIAFQTATNATRTLRVSGSTLTGSSVVPVQATGSSSNLLTYIFTGNVTPTGSTITGITASNYYQFGNTGMAVYDLFSNLRVNNLVATNSILGQSTGGTAVNMIGGTGGARVMTMQRDSLSQSVGLGVGTDAIILWNETDNIGIGYLFADSNSIAWLGGAGNGGASPRALAIRPEDASSGTDSPGTNLVLQAAAGTGSSTTGGKIIFQTPDAGSSGTTVQTRTTKAELSRTGTFSAAAGAFTNALTVGGVLVATKPTTETLAYSSTTVTVTAGKGPNQSSVLTCTNNFTLSFSSVADNDGGTIWVHPAATNCTVTLSSPAYGPTGTTLTIAGGTGSTNHTVLAWKATTVNSTNVINVNALNYYR